MTECSVEGAPPRCYGRAPLRDNGGGPGWVEGGDFTHLPGFAPQSLPTSPLPQNLAAGGTSRRSPGVDGRHVPRSITPAPRPPRDLKPGKSRQSSQGGECRNQRRALCAQHPQPGSEQPRARGSGCAAAERSGAGGERRSTRPGRRAPLFPLPRFVPSTFAPSDWIVG